MPPTKAADSDLVEALVATVRALYDQVQDLQAVSEGLMAHAVSTTNRLNTHLELLQAVAKRLNAPHAITDDTSMVVPAQAELFSVLATGNEAAIQHWLEHFDGVST